MVYFELYYIYYPFLQREQERSPFCPRKGGRLLSTFCSASNTTRTARFSSSLFSDGRKIYTLPDDDTFVTTFSYRGSWRSGAIYVPEILSAPNKLSIHLGYFIKYKQQMNKRS